MLARKKAFFRGLGAKNHQFAVVEAFAFSDREIEYSYRWVKVFS
jgi:hypothetical protein